MTLRLTNLYLEQERYDQVVALNNEELDNVVARWNIAKAYQALEEDEAALEIYDQLREDLADNPEFLADYIAALRLEGDIQLAKELAHRYLHLVPDDLIMQEFYNEVNHDGDQ